MTKEMFDQQVLALERVLYRVTYSMLPNPHDQADAVQECIKKALIKRETLKDDRYFKTWLIRILVNECHNIQRQRKRMTPTEEIEIVVQPDVNRSLFEALQSLDEKHRLPIVLHHISGYTTKEVAQILRIPEGTVKYRLVHGRSRLEAILQEEEA